MKMFIFIVILRQLDLNQQNLLNWQINMNEQYISIVALLDFHRKVKMGSLFFCALNFTNLNY